MVRTAVLVCLFLGGLTETSAQVYSQNVVGYVNILLYPGDNLIANPLDDGYGNTLNELFNYGCPNRTTFKMWDPEANQYLPVSTYSSLSHSWSINYTFDSTYGGQGGLLFSPTLWTNTFVGNVVFYTNIVGDPGDPGWCPNYSNGLYLLTCPVPVAGPMSYMFTNVTGRLPVDKEWVKVFDPASQTYITTTFHQRTKTWDNGDPGLYVGESAWFNLGPVAVPPGKFNSPVITEQPHDVAVGIADTAVFSVTATNSEPLYYQWYFNGAVIAGATNSLLTFSNVLTFNQGEYQVRITNSQESIMSDPAQLTATCPAVMLDLAALVDGTAGVGYNQGVSASGGVAPYQFTKTGTLPNGLTLSNGGVLSGTPTHAGVFSFTVTATDANGCTGSSNCMLHIGCPMVTLSPATLAGGTAGAIYSQSVSANGGVAPYQYTKSGILPGGLTLSSGGVLTGTPTNANVFNFTVVATDANGCTGSSNYTVNVVCPTVTLNPATLTDGTVGASYSQSVSSGGGTAPYKYTKSGTLPDGLTLSSGGVLSGTPTNAGAFDFTVTTTDANGCIGSSNYKVNVICPTIMLSPTNLPDGEPGIPYSQTNAASGGIVPYVYAVTGGALPDGLSISSSGVLSGTPTNLGAFSFTVTATDANGCSGSSNRTVRVVCPTILLSALPNAGLGIGYAQTNAACGGVGACVFDVTDGSLPTGLTLDTSGVISGTPAVNGDYSFTITAADTYGCTGSSNYTLNVSCPAISLSPSQLPDGYRNIAYARTNVASGGVAPYTYAVTGGALPAGLTLSTNGVLSGTTTTADGGYAFTVTATDANGCTGSSNYTINVTCAPIALSPGTLPLYLYGYSYNESLTAVGGVPPYFFAVNTNFLPTGLTMTSNGTLTALALPVIGCPRHIDLIDITVTLTDANGCTGSAIMTLPVTICAISQVSETNKPTVAITLPKNKTTVTSYATMISGTAKAVGANTGIASVRLSVNGGAPQSASTANQFTNWTAIVSLHPGTNTVTAQSFNYSGTASDIVTNQYVLKALAPLTLIKNGSGTVAPNLNTSNLVLLAGYKLTATPALNNLFSNWVVSVNGVTKLITNTPKLAFTMQSNLVVTANFVTNRFVEAGGTYFGLFAAPEVAQESAGFLRVTTTARSSFTGSLTVDGKIWPISGKFNLDGVGTASVNRVGKPNLTVSLQLGFDDTVSGSVSNADWLATLAGNRTAFSALTPAMNFVGSYTLVIPGTPFQPDRPAGNGYATISVNSLGAVKATGALGDGNAFVPVAASLSADGRWPLFSQQYGKTNGLVIGWLQFRDNAANSTIIATNLYWIKKAWNGSPLYPAGFTNAGFTAFGSVLTGTSTEPLVFSGPFGDFAAVTLEGGNLPGIFTSQLGVVSQNKMLVAYPNLNNMTFSFTGRSGLVSGTFSTAPMRGAAKMAVKGVYLQSTNFRYVGGYFLGPSESGSLLIQGD